MITITDIDNTVIKPIGENRFPLANNFTLDQRLINQEVFKNIGGTLVGLSSQAGIQQGFITEKMCIDRFQYTMKLMPQLNVICFTPSWCGSRMICCFSDGLILEVFADKGESFRKPDIASINFFEELFNDKVTAMIGDGEDDEAFAKNANIKFKLV